MKKWTIIIGLGIASVAGTAVLAADGPSEVSLDQVQGSKGAVKFSHAKHAKEIKVGGNAIACKDCHHTMTAATDKAQSCTSCHVKEGEAQKDVNGKKADLIGLKDKMNSVLYHKTCLDNCHKKKPDGKNISGCKSCHK